MSVTVVKITAPDKAGSIFNLFNSAGIITPDAAAVNKFNNIAKAITKLNIKLSNQIKVIAPMTTDQIKPLSPPTFNSLRSNTFLFCSVI